MKIYLLSDNFLYTSTYKEFIEKNLTKNRADEISIIIKKFLIFEY